jgi:hypothetical protein
VKLWDEVSYPSPRMKRLSFLHESLSLYEGTISLQAPLMLDRQLARGGSVDAPTVSASLRLQACSDQVSLASEEIRLRLPAVGIVN